MAYAEDITDNGTIRLVEEDIEYIRENLCTEIAAELDVVWGKIRDLAIELCPKESGALASSIELESEGGSGMIGVSQTAQGGEFYSNAIYAGNDQTFNREGQPTSQYAVAVHEGHLLKNGMFWEGNPFLTDAIDYYDAELNSAVDRALSELLD
jgi:hypothetical protein